MKFHHIQQFFFFGLLILTTGVFFWMLGKYLLPVFWAVVIALVFYPLYEVVLRTLRGRASLAALASVFIVTLIVLTPLVFIGGLIVQESLSVYESVSSTGEDQGGLLLDKVNVVTTYLEPYGISQTELEARVRAWISDGAQTLAYSLLAFGQGTVSFLISGIIMLYLLFFFFKDGKKLKRTIIHYLPFGGDYEDRLFTRFFDTTQAVVKGTFMIAALQGAIGGLAFWAVGVPSPVLWGVAMALLAVLPGFGTPIVWLPVALFLIFTGSVWSGIIILLVGAVFVSLIDEFLRPTLVGRRAKMPDALVLLSTIGGLSTFGVTGFIAGPVIAAFFLSLWTVFEERYHEELTTKK